MIATLGLAVWTVAVVSAVAGFYFGWRIDRRRSRLRRDGRGRAEPFFFAGPFWFILSEQHQAFRDAKLSGLVAKARVAQRVFVVSWVAGLALMTASAMHRS